MYIGKLFITDGRYILSTYLTSKKLIGTMLSVFVGHACTVKIGIRFLQREIDRRKKDSVGLIIRHESVFSILEFNKGTTIIKVQI